MIKNVTKRFLSLLLTVIMVLALLPVTGTTVYAANVNTGVEGLTAASSGSATWTTGNGTITGSVTASASSGCTGTSYTAQTGTLTFTNSMEGEAILNFAYTLTPAGGSVTVDGTPVSAGDTFNKKLQSGETVAVSITSPKGEGTTTITIEGISLKEPRDVETTFVPAENGSYTVDGTAITQETVLTKNSAEEYTLKATPASGYKFAGWYSLTKNEYLSFSENAGLKFDEEQSVTARFVSSDTAMFGVSGAVFTNLNEAVQYASDNGKPIIILLSDGILPAGDYTIPSGKTLLIPFDAANTIYTTAPEVVYGSHDTPSAFRTLTMAEGAHITVADGGSISVPSKLCATGTNSGSWNGTPTGKHGRITMRGGSSIDVSGGGSLYVYGYISGDGSVTAHSGATVYECFQIRCWRGGTATSDMAGNSQKVFPLNQYYVQNIEAPLTLESGATERVYTAVNMRSQAFAASATFIGSGGMFTPSGSVTKRYDGGSDRLVLDVDGDFSITPMSLRISDLPLIGTLDLNTSDYVLPINSNISIHVNSGETTLSQDIAFLPGSELTVAQGASVTLASGKKAYVYDKDEWGAYAASGLQLVPVGYSTVNGTAAKRTTASLTDAKLNINGELHLNGALYTTESGAAIVSSEGTGKVIFENASGTETSTYQATQSGSDISYVSIPITSAKLLNGDASYTETADAEAGSTYYFCRTCNPAGVWEKEHSTSVYKLILQANIPEDSPTELTEEESVIEIDIPEEELETFTFPEDTFTCIGYDLTGWIRVLAETDSPIEPAVPDTQEEEAIPAESINDTVKDLFAEGVTELTLKAAWTPKEITVTFDVPVDTTTGPEDITCAYGNTITLPAADQVVREHYVLTGWTLGDQTYEPGAEYTVAGEFEDNKVVFTAKWEGQKYTVTWMNGEEEITSSEVTYGDTPVYEGDTPVKAEDEQHTYTFTGWNPEIGPVEGDQVYTAVFEETVRKYTITFIHEDGTVLQTGETAYGEMPVYEGDIPAKAATAEKEYTFAGWTPELTEVTGEETYVATFSEADRKYTVTWKNDDGTVLKTEQAVYGAVPAYDGETPQKAPDPGYTYTFSGWSPEITAVTEDVEYTAQYSREANTYTVTWKNSDGTVLETDENVAYMAMPSYDGETPQKEASAQYEYTFKKWTPELTEVTGDVTYTAVYTESLRNYTVTWRSEDGSKVLGTKNVPYGETPVYEGEQPVKENTDQYTYQFAGWYKNDAEEPVTTFDPVEGDVTYKAAFSETVNQYTVTFKDEDGTVLESRLWDYGTVPEYDTSGLTKEATAEYTYTFDGWTPQVREVTGDAAYTATYTAVKNTYTVTWVIDGEKTEETYEYGQMPSHGDPSKDATAEYTYTFAGWQPAPEEVTGNAEYTAVFTAERRSYTVTWEDENGDVLYSQQVEYGQVPVYGGVTPMKEADEEFTYTFAGWTPNVAEVTGDVTYTATYTTDTNSYEIKWVDYDGSELKAEVLEYGSMPSAPGDPYREADDQYSYSFAGWKPAVTSVTEAATYTAVYDAELRSYTIRFVDEDGNTLDEQTLHYGSTPAYSGQTPSREPTDQYTYAFKGWDPAIDEVTGDQTYTVIFEETVNTYSVTWKDEDGTVLETDPAVPYGEMPSYDSEEPVKEATAQYEYQFDGWDPEVSEVTGDVTYTARYTQTEKSYTVTWVNDEKDDEGNYIVLEKDENVPYGEKPAYDGTTPEKAATDQYSYTFDKWVLLENPAVTLSDDDTVTGDVTYLAVYTAALRSYTVTWVNEDGTVLETDRQVTYGSMPVYDGTAPEKVSTDAQVFTFSGWDPEVAEVTGDVTYTARFTPAARQYAVTWKNGDTVLATTYVDYGSNPAVPEEAGEPEKDETVTHTYTFSGWEDEDGKALNEETAVTGDMVFSAAFTEEAKSGWVRWTDNKIYYVDDGKTATGICRLTYPEDGSFGYAEPAWDDALDSGHPEDGKGTFIFDSDGVLQTGENGFYAFQTANDNTAYDTAWLNSDGTVWAVRGEIIWHPGLVQADGQFYYFKTDNTMVKARDYAITKTNGLSYEDDGRTVSFVRGGRYTFDADGVLLILNGFVDTGGVTYYFVDSVKTYAGLIKVGDDYYYVKSDCTVVKGRNYYVGKTNGLMEAGTYAFDEEGKMIREAQTGIYRGDDGLLHYYIDGAIQKNLGLIELEGSFYYVNGSGEVISGRDYAITKTNDLTFTRENGQTAAFKAQATYTFDGNGVLQLYDGLVDRNGSKYYYEAGIKTYAGLIKIGEDYYYIKSDCTAVRDRSYYVSKTNGLMEAGNYDFDTDGRMIIASEGSDTREGIMKDENGVLRYYVDDVAQKNLGLIELDGRFYYVNGSGEVINGKDYNITKTNGLRYQKEDGSAADFVSGGKYTFGDDGALCWYDGIADVGGVKYYYVNGVKTYAGLIQIGGDYYYVNSSCKLVTNSSYYVSKTNGLREAGTYSFDAEGRLTD